MAEINQVENREATEKSVKANIGSLTKTNKLDKHLARLAKKSREVIKFETEVGKLLPTIQK
jgi:DNA-binding transcriptional regulator GbsR (MarR family)